MNSSTHQSAIVPDESIKSQLKSNPQAWYRPTLSPEHGVYVVLLVAFLTGAAAAQHWTWMTTLALMGAFLGFQAEHPLVLQVKQRRSWKPRFLVWGGLYGTIALSIAIFLYLHLGDSFSPLLWIYAGAVVAFGVDIVSAFYREQKSIVNEFVTFAAVCLSAPFAYITTTGSISTLAIALWILNTLYFSSTIFIVKFRKLRTHPVVPSLIYHTIATIIILVLWSINWLPSITALAFIVALFKFVVILWLREWYCTTKIQYVALLETLSAVGFLAIVALPILPTRLG